MKSFKSTHKISPGWGEVCYLNTLQNEKADTRSYLLSYVFALLEKQYGFAIEVAEKAYSKTNDAFFKKLYGDCRRGSTARHLRSVPWFPKGQMIKVTELNGVADELARVSSEIDNLPDEMKRAAYPIAGVYSCRPVADTGKVSMHSYAAAIDLNLAYADYWIWQSKGGKQKIRYRNRMPREIVEIFERHGFIWGGRWYHFDTMHFEYRPELLTRAATAKPPLR